MHPIFLFQLKCQGDIDTCFLTLIKVQGIVKSERYCMIFFSISIFQKVAVVILSVGQTNQPKLVTWSGPYLPIADKASHYLYKFVQTYL